MIANCRTVIFLFLFLIVSASAEDRKCNIAVLDFNTNSFTKKDIIGLTGRLNYLIFNTGQYNIIERSMLEEILKEQGFQKTGCTNTQCAVEIGQLIGVEKICIGSFNKVGSFITSNARLVDVSTGKIEKMASVECERCDIDYVYKYSIKRIVEKLILTREPEYEKPIYKNDQMPFKPEKVNPGESQEEIFHFDTSDIEGTKVNPQGYCGSVNPGFTLGYNMNNQRLEFESSYYDGFDDNYHYLHLNGGILIPATPYLSIVISNSTYLGENTSISHMLGLNIFTKSIRSLSELKNPDGPINSSIISPQMDLAWIGEDFARIAIGAGFGYVTTSSLSLSANIMYARLAIAETNGFYFSISPLFHLGSSSKSVVNPDGFVGSVNLSPSYGMQIYENGRYVDVGAILTIPFSEKITGIFSISYGNGKENPSGLQYTSNSFLIRTGLNIYTR